MFKILFDSLRRSKTGGTLDSEFATTPPLPQPPQRVVHVTTVEVKFTDLKKVPVYRVMKNHETQLSRSQDWRTHGYSDRQRDIEPFLGDRQYRISMMWGYKVPGRTFDDLVLLEQVEAAPRLPVLID